MAIENVRKYMQQYGIEERIMEFEVSSATVELAARRFIASRGVLPRHCLLWWRMHRF